MRTSDRKTAGIRSPVSEPRSAEKQDRQQSGPDPPEQARHRPDGQPAE